MPGREDPAASVGSAPSDEELIAYLDGICSVLQRRTGHDFGRYKQGTLLRRIRRRLHAHRAASGADYLRVLEQDPQEAERLLGELLLGVTQFFRDPEAFEALAGLVVPGLVAGEAAELPIRVWVAGCASGEEAYTLAILLREQLEREGARRPLQIFATDMDGELLAEARAGRYGAQIGEQVSPERLQRFFVHEVPGYRAAKELREACIFSQHSLIRDPPFSSLDLISCRNLLIYLEPDLQAKLVPLFHYALRPGGHLFLGSAEGLAAHGQLFEAVDKRHRIFRRNEVVVRPPLELPCARRGAPFAAQPPPADRAPAALRQEVGAAFERMVLGEYAAPSAVVDARGDILLVAGRIGRFFQPPSGALSTNLLEVAPPGLRTELRTALHAAATTRRKVVRDELHVEVDDAVRCLRLTVRPLPGVDPAAGLLAVVLQEHAAPEEDEGVEAPPTSLEQPAMEQLESELFTTRTELKAAVEKLASANEELESSNEELVSTNEELQSANEELQTSKEELQSLNEELETVNAELERKVEELGTANADLANLFASTEIATIFLDRELRVAKFTPAATGLFNLIEADLGRPLGDLAPRFVGEDLVAEAREVLRTLAPIERQIRAADGRAWFILRVLPYRTVEDVIAGVVVTFVDVSELQRAGEALREGEERFRLLVEGARDHSIYMLAPDGSVVTWNVGAERMKGYRAEEIVGRHFSVFFAAEDVRAARPEKLLEAAVAAGTVEDEGWRTRKDGSRFWANVVITALRDEAGRLRGFGKVTRDFTERKRHEEHLRQAHERAAWLARFPSENPDPVLRLSGDFTLLYANAAARSVLGELLLEQGREVPQALALPARQAIEGSCRVRYEIACGGRHFLLTFSPVGAETNVYGQDITDRKRAEEVLRESEARLKRAQEIAHLGSWELDLVRNQLSWSDEVYRIFGLRPQEFGATYEAFLEAVHPEDRTAVDQAYSSSLRDGRDTYEIEHRVVRRATGEVRMVHEKCEHSRDGSGRIVRSVGMVHDVTERKRAEAELERSRQAMQRMVETSTRVMRETTVEGLLKAVSAAALELTGGRIAACGHGFAGGQLVVGGASRVPGAPDCPSGNALAQDQGGVFMDLVGGADALRLTDAELRAHPRWRGPPQDHVPLRGLLGARMVGRQGETSGMILVTDKEGGEFGAEDESLLRQLGNIASLAAQHVEARLSLEESDRLKNQFLAMLSHELRNPLAPIRNSLRVLERAAPGGEQARRAQAVIDRQVGHMTRLVEDLLDVTRVSRGKILLKRAPLDLGEVVLRVVEDHRSAFVDAGIRLQTAIPYHPVGIHADRTRVVQVIGNLLENAVKFTQRGGEVSVAVETSWSLQQAAVRVRDTGAGIERGMLPRLFEPFTQADTTLDRSKGGLGLGLALVKALVEMHGGTVSVESEGPGMGAEFTVLFPLGAGALSPAAPAPGSAPGGVARRVLVIEDSVDAAESLREALELGEHAVEVAYSGAEGVERARTFRPEVVLCDIGLPGMDGYQVARTMRTDPALRETTLVALSGYATPDDVARAKAAGFDRHLAKPLDLEALERLFEELSADVARPGHQGRVTP